MMQSPALGGISRHGLGLEPFFRVKIIGALVRSHGPRHNITVRLRRSRRIRRVRARNAPIARAAFSSRIYIEDGSPAGPGHRAAFNHRIFPASSGHPALAGNRARAGVSRHRCRAKPGPFRRLFREGKPPGNCPVPGALWGCMDVSNV